MARVCALAHLGGCSPGLSREHYISDAVLKLLFNGEKGTIQGTAFAPAAMPISIGSLTAKILCQKHNSDLSPLDTVARDIVAVLQRAQHEYENKFHTSWRQRVSGDLFERWLLKVVFGMWAGGVLAANAKKITGHPPIIWGDLITGRASFPLGWGLYLKLPAGAFKTVPRQIGVLPITRVTDGQVVAAQIELAGMPFSVCLGKPDIPFAIGIFRPSAINFQHADVSKCIKFHWAKEESGQKVDIVRL